MTEQSIIRNTKKIISRLKYEKSLIPSFVIPSLEFSSHEIFHSENVYKIVRVFRATHDMFKLRMSSK